MSEKQRIENAIQVVKENFPFPGYMDFKECGYINIAATILRYLHAGSRILDFGSGPCDVTAIIRILGFNCSAYDDLLDDWQKIGRNQEKIISFAQKMGVDFYLKKTEQLPFDHDSFDMIMMLDVLEHLHSSPRELLGELLTCLKPEGYLLISVPNAVNIRKRIDVLLGKTNYPPFDTFYWYPGPWRGHVREYVKLDLVSLANYLNLDIVELRGCHHMVAQKVSRCIRPLYFMATGIFNDFRDTWLLLAKKNKNWTSGKSYTREELNKVLNKALAYKFLPQKDPAKTA